MCVFVVYSKKKQVYQYLYVRKACSTLRGTGAYVRPLRFGTVRTVRYQYIRDSKRYPFVVQIQWSNDRSIEWLSDLVRLHDQII